MLASKALGEVLGKFLKAVAAVGEVVESVELGGLDVLIATAHAREALLMEVLVHGLDDFLGIDKTCAFGTALCKTLLVTFGMKN